MLYAISWFVSLSLLAVWSLLCWGVHAFTVWAMSSAGALAAGAAGAAGAASVSAIWLPPWLQGWIPPELLRSLEGWITSAGPLLQAALESVPALAGAVTVLAWGIWGLGVVVLTSLAVGLHVLVRLLQRHTSARAAVAVAGPGGPVPSDPAGGR